jgi:CubicO group peptidase (beta-lactamase class C family)
MIRAIAGLGALTLCAAACSAPDPSLSAISHSRKIVNAYVSTTQVPALQIAVGIDDQIVWSEGFGGATPATRFRIASVSKLLTGTLTAKLADRGELSLDQPIGEWVLGLPPDWHDITARMLVHHTSGLQHYDTAERALDTTFYPTTRAGLARFLDMPLKFAPGTGEQYSTYAYTVLALAIEQAMGKPFLEVMDDEILKPLGMVHTGPDLRSSPSPDLAPFFDLSDSGAIVASPEVDLSGKWAGGGYVSTAEDLVRFGLAHVKQGVLSAETIAMVGQRQTLPSGELTKEGFGWGPRVDWDGREMLWGDGSTPGARCGLLVYPKDGLVIAVLTNLRGLALERGELQALARLFLAAKDGKEILPVSTRLEREWVGSVAVGSQSVPVRISPGSVEFGGWRTLTVADAFQIGESTWIVPLDKAGIFPLRLAVDGEGFAVTAPRVEWKFGVRPG